MQKNMLRLFGAAGMCLLLSTLCYGAEPVKIGMITTLSTKAGYLGEDIRDGFKLAMDQEDGKLGGIPVELLVEDDGSETGKRQTDRRKISSRKTR